MIASCGHEGGSVVHASVRILITGIDCATRSKRLAFQTSDLNLERLSKTLSASKLVDY